MTVAEDLKNNELTIKDLEVWNEDFTDVEKVFETVKDRDLQGIIDKLHHLSGFDITSDTHEPLEYIDFNYGSLCCTISIYNDENKPKLLAKGIEGYIRNEDGEELAGYFNFDIDEVRDILNKE